jgi:undecaprenol kinase
MNISKPKEQIKFRKQSFYFALAGYKAIWLSEINFRIHIIITLIVIFAGVILKLNMVEWIVVLISVGMVLTAEIFNTTIEHLCNLISTEIRPDIKIIKDIGASGVLVSAVISAITGVIIFLPKLILIFSSL